MNAFAAPTNFIATAAASSAPEAADEAMRIRLFDQFNAYWLKAAGEGVPYDVIGTMSVTAAVYGLLAKHGGETTATFLEGLAGDIRTGAFTVPSRTN